MAGVALLALAASLTALPLSADFSKPAWRYFKPILLPPGIPEMSLVEVVPDQEVFAHAGPSLTDLRIVEIDSGQEVPYKLLVERGEQRRATVNVSIRDLGHVPGQYTSFIADLGQEGVLHNELEIHTPSRNFQRRVVVEGSDDGALWAVLEDRGQIFDFTAQERNFNTRDTRARYPSSTSKYLRVRILNDGEPPLDITGAVAYFAQVLPPRESKLSPLIISREEDAEHKRTLLVLDLATAGFPTSRISIVTPQQNFYRQVRLEGSDDAQGWSTVQRSEVLYVYNTPKFIGSKVSLGYPEASFRYYRLTILNEDNPPLVVAGAQVYSFQRKVLFPIGSGSDYRLYYGNAAARTPSYELERIFSYLVTENLPIAQLGSHTPNAAFVEAAEPFTERYPWMLSTVVAIAALIIGVFLTRLLREVRRMLPPPSPP